MRAIYRNLIISFGIFFLVLIAGRPAQSAGPQYTVTDLGTMGWASSYATKITDSGYIIGQLGPTVLMGNDTVGFVYRNGTMTPLTLGGRWSYALDINESGKVVGQSTTTSNNSDPFRAFTYYNGTMTDMSSLFSNARYSKAVSINDAGQIAGSYQHNPDFYNDDFTVGFRYSPNGAINSLQIPGGYANYIEAINRSGQVAGQTYLPNLYYLGDLEHVTFSSGGSQLADLGNLGAGYTGRSRPGNMYTFNGDSWLNNNGQVVGYAELEQSGLENGRYHAFLYGNGQMNDLGTLGGSWSRAVSINDAGQVTGESVTAGGTKHVFVYINGVMIDLGTLGGSDCQTYKIDSNGRIIGNSKIAGDADTHAFLYDPATGMIDLNSLISPDSGWDIINARDINANGQIVGEGIINGQTHAILLNPVPIPPALYMFGTGLLGLGFLRRKFFRN